MRNSVLFTGDAGALEFIDETLNEIPRSTFNFCCTCSYIDKQESNLAPLKKKTIWTE